MDCGGDLKEKRRGHSCGSGKSSLLKMSTFALAALPGAIMTDKGVLDGQSQTFMPVFR